MEDLSGKQFGPYQIVSPCGEGGMAAVYKAYQASMNRYVAVKVLPQIHSTNPEFVKRFNQEAQVLAKLIHPYIVPIHDYGESDGYTYLVMPFMKNGTLADLMLGEPFPLPRILKIITQIGEAMAYAHSLGLVHRDIKPSNILMDESGNCMLTDFGIARILESSSEFTVSGTILGTPAYMSPEQGSGLKADHRSDIYSLGVILYELITGRVPYKADTPVAVIFKHVHEPLPAPRSFNPDIPEDVERVILKSLAKNPEDRFQSVQAMLKALEAASKEDFQHGSISQFTPTIVDSTPLVSEQQTYSRGMDEPGGEDASESSSGRPEEKRAEIARKRRLGTIGWVIIMGISAICIGAISLSIIYGLKMISGETKATESSEIPTAHLQETDTPRPAQVLATPSPTFLPPSEQVVPCKELGCIAFTVGEEGAWQIQIFDPADNSSWLLPGQLGNSGVAAWSPDGEHIAFKSDVSGRWQIYSLNLDGSELKQITSGNYDNFEPAWSPAGDRIAFVSDRTGDKEIYLIDSSGKNEQRITDNPGWDDDPSWSPDGEWIALESERSGRKDIFKMNIDSGELIRLTSEGDFNGTPAWSPDGVWIAFERRTDSNYHLWVMRSDGSGQKQLTFDGSRNLRPAWSPDSQRIAFTSDRSGVDSIWILSLDSSGGILGLSPGKGIDPAWSR